MGQPAEFPKGLRAQKQGSCNLSRKNGHRRFLGTERNEKTFTGSEPGNEGFAASLGELPMIRHLRIRPFEIGLVFRDGTFRGLLGPGAYWRFDPLLRERIDIVSQRAPWLVHEQLDLIVRSGVLADRAVALDLQDHERGLVW